MKKEYTIKELTDILGCSRTAIVKKIKEHPDKPGVRMYRERYEVVTHNNQMAILLDDIDLEHEKRLSQGVNSVTQQSVDTQENGDYIDVEPVKEASSQPNLLEFAERYMERYNTLQETLHNTILEFNDTIKEKDDQIKLLTTSENIKQSEHLRVEAENKTLRINNTTLKKHNLVLTVSLGVVITVLLIFVTVLITYMTLTSHFDNQDIKKEPIQKIEQAQ